MDKFEKKLYEIASEEVLEKRPKKSIFAKALSDAMGDKEKAASLYIKYRVKQLKKESIRKADEEIEKVREAEMEKLRRII